MKTILSIMLIFCSLPISAQFDMPFKRIRVDSLSSRQDTIWLTNKKGGTAWIRISSLDSLYFGDAKGEVSLGTLRNGGGGGSTVYANSGLRMDGDTIKLGDSIYSTSDSILINPKYNLNSAFLLGSFKPFENIKINIYDLQVNQYHWGDSIESINTGFFKINEQEIELVKTDFNTLKSTGLLLKPDNFYYEYVDTTKFTNNSIPNIEWVKNKINQSGFYKKSVTLTAAQINSSTNVEIVPTPGIGKYIEVISGTITYKFNTTSFSGNQTVRLSWGSDLSGGYYTMNDPVFTGSSSFQFPLIFPLSATPGTEVRTNKALYFGIAGLTGGDGTVKVDVTYTVNDY